jgi:hypothetical protein
MFLWENPPTSLVTEIPVEPPTFDYTPSEGESFLRMIVSGCLFALHSHIGEVELVRPIGGGVI